MKSAIYQYHSHFSIWTTYIHQYVSAFIMNGRLFINVFPVSSRRRGHAAAFVCMRIRAILECMDELAHLRPVTSAQTGLKEGFQQ
jgi:hypothetical protein